MQEDGSTVDPSPRLANIALGKTSILPKEHSSLRGEGGSRERPTEGKLAEGSEGKQRREGMMGQTKKRGWNLATRH